MKKLLFLFIILSGVTNVSYAAFPVFENLMTTTSSFVDSGEEIGETIGSVLEALLVLFGLYYLIKTYKDTYNPWIKSLKLIGIIFFSLLLLIGVLCGIDGGCLSFSGG
ncbi:MAG: hypothetical protein VYD71_00610 [Bacteroidota bacterium]|nr:hypothetical protein [Bacteroidota bacterium]